MKEKLEKSTEEIQIKKDELMALNIAADSQLKIKETMTAVTDKVTNISEVLERFENKIDEKNIRRKVKIGSIRYMVKYLIIIPAIITAIEDKRHLTYADMMT